MAVVQTAQETITDISDAYSVTLTSEAYTFPAGVTAALAGTTTTMVQAMRGSNPVSATVDQASIKGLPTGLTAAVNANDGSPVVTFTATTSLTTKAGNVTIPVKIVDGGVTITIEKVFSYALSNKGDTGAKGDKGTGVTISSQSVTYQASASGTETPTGTWSSSVPTVANGQYLWTKTVVTYSDKTSTTSYSVAYKGTNGANGASVTIASKSVTYQVSSSGTSVPTDSWSETVPTVGAGQYLWTRTVVTYNGSNGSTTSYAVSRNGTNGTNGADAVTMGITSSNGTIFRNNTGSTTLTAWVRVGGKEAAVSDAGVATYGGKTIGTVMWYAPGATSGTAAKSVTVTAAQVESTAQYTAQLEA